MNPLKTFAAAGGAALLAVALVAAQSPRARIFTQPEPPPREVLDRLNLVQDWRTYVPMEGRRDGFASIQPEGDQLLVQTRSGMVAAVDALTGRVLWRTRAGRPYQPTLPLAYNRRAVYYLNGTYLYALDRATGAVVWQFSVPGGGVSAPPVADEFQIYLSSGDGRLSAYVLPLPLIRQRVIDGDRAAPGLPPAPGAPAGPAAAGQAQADREEAARARTAEAGSRGAVGAGTLGALTRTAPEVSGPQPFLRWEAVTGLRLELAPLSWLERVSVVDTNGVVLGYEKYPEDVEGAVEVFRVRLAADTVAVPPGQYERTAYVGSRDANLYAVDLRSGQEVWRYTAGSPVTRRPAVTFQDVYVTSEQGGLARVDRARGEPVWRVPAGPGVTTDGNREADRFLAANPKFVYAADASNRLLVLDRQRGTVLSSYGCTHDFVFPVANEVTDRLILAANNGLLLSLHDRDYATPYRHRRTDQLLADPKTATVVEKLLIPVTDKSGGEAVTLETLLRAFRRDYGLEVVFAENAAGLEKRLVALPRVTAVPLGEVLRRVLAQVNATYGIVEGRVVVTPLARQ
jgi:outer membrane protein assembly factor BamB